MERGWSAQKPLRLRLTVELPSTSHHSSWKIMAIVDMIIYRWDTHTNSTWWLLIPKQNLLRSPTNRLLTLCESTAGRTCRRRSTVLVRMSTCTSLLTPARKVPDTTSPLWHFRQLKEAVSLAEKLRFRQRFRWSLIAVKSCGGNISSIEVATITDPDHPKPFIPSIDCTWPLSLPSNKPLRLTFTKLGLVIGPTGICDGDYVTIADVTDPNSAIKICGTVRQSYPFRTTNLLLWQIHS